MKPWWPLFALPLVMMAGCDSFGGINSHVALLHHPVPGCVERALASEGATGVRRSQSEWARSRSDPTAPMTRVDQWDYRLSGQSGLRVEIYDGEWGLSYSNGIGTTAGRVPDSRIDALRPLIVRVNAAVSRECAIDFRDIDILEIRIRDPEPNQQPRSL